MLQQWNKEMTLIRSIFIGMFLTTICSGATALECNISKQTSSPVCNNFSGLCLQTRTIDGSEQVHIYPDAKQPPAPFDSVRLTKEIKKYRFLGCPFWSSKGNKLYFLSDYSATSYRLVVVDVSNGTSVSIPSVESFEVVKSDKYLDYIIVRLRRHKLFSLWIWYWLYDPDLLEVGPIGDMDDLDLFRLDVLTPHKD
jgi:hypothetical protein